MSRMPAKSRLDAAARIRELDRLALPKLAAGLGVDRAYREALAELDAQKAIPAPETAQVCNETPKQDA